MKILTNRIAQIVAGATLIVLVFWSGYLVGSKTHQNTSEQTQTLSSSDMEHAFGNVKNTYMDASFGNVKATPHEASTQDSLAMSLSGLVEGLEKKVAANPENIEQQLLLAQTYNELDSRDKSLELLRKLNKKSPNNAQVKITFATVLMKGNNKQELKESLQMFDEAIKLSPDVAKMAGLYKGEVKVKLENMSK